MTVNNLAKAGAIGTGLRLFLPFCLGRLVYVLLTVAFLVAACTSSSQAQKRFTFEHPQMGTLFRIICYAETSGQAEVACKAAFRRIDSLNQVFSDYIPDSEVVKLAETAGQGSFSTVSEDLWKVLSEAQILSENSEGAFDISIGALSRLWRRAFRRQEFPDRARLELAKKTVDYRELKLDPKKKAINLGLPGMRLDAGGIAKGYTVDAAMEVLQTFGITQALVDGGGDLLASGPPPGTEGWEVLLPEANNVDEVILLENEALATSGDTYKYLEFEGQRFSHIIDPRTGLGVQHRIMATVKAKTCTLADALASTLTILSPEDSEELLEKYPGTSARLWMAGEKKEIIIGHFSPPK